MSTAEIIAELAHLGPDELAAVRAWLDRQISGQSEARPLTPRPAVIRLRSPRLADPSQAGDFVKRRVEPATNASL